MGRGSLGWIAWTVALFERVDDVVTAFERRARMRREQLLARREAAERLAANLNAWRRQMELDHREASRLEEGDAS